MAKNVSLKLVRDIKFNHVSDPNYDWESLEKSLYFEGYEPRKYGFIRVFNNRCINGNHRLQVITKCKSNLDKLIEVHEVGKFNYYSALVSISVFLPFYFAYYVISKTLRKVGILKALPKYKWTGKYYFL